MSERIRPGDVIRSMIGFEIRTEVAHQLSRVVTSHLDVGASLGRREVTPCPVDLRSVP